MNTQVTLSGWTLDNPVIPASGTFGYGYEFAEWYDINMLGTFSFKGTTQEARFGNPTPRIADAPAGMLNAVGLQNPGVRAVIREELPRLKRVFHKKVIANVSGFSVEEYARTCALLDREEQVGLAVLLYAVLKEQKKTKGRARLETLVRSGKPLTVYSVKESDLKQFVTEAKRYGILYCAVRNPKGSIQSINT